jgi:molybdate transport system substrate-binding protein
LHRRRCRILHLGGGFSPFDKRDRESPFKAVPGFLYGMPKAAPFPVSHSIEAVSGETLQLLRSFFLVLCCSGSLFAQAITVAAAADLSVALAELAGDYQRQTGDTVKLAFGSSGNLLNQVENGAPFDLFLSADEDYPRQLVRASLAESSSFYRYAVGKLVVWVPASSGLDVEHRGINVLLDPAVNKVAIANPQHAPYGRAAEAALRYAGIYDRVANRLVLGENVSQAAQFVESGSAQVGLVALSHAMAPMMRGKGRYWEIPQDAYPPLNQAAVILSRSPHKKQAAKFLQFIKTPEAKAVFERYGFSTPGEH